MTRLLPVQRADETPRVERVAREIQGLPEDQEGYWPEERGARQTHSPKYYQYPAMMVPSLQGAMMDVVLTHFPRATRLADPFMGSGTVLAEGIWRGADFVGQDLNPLSLLICKVRAGPHRPATLAQGCDALTLRIRSNGSRHVDVNFPGRDKWFKPTVIIDLCRIKRAIEAEPRLWCRRFFWLAFAETVRQVSNSRSSTVKLHIMSQEQLADHSPNAIGVFSQVLTRFLVAYRECAKELDSSKLLKRGQHSSNVCLRLGDTSQSFEVKGSAPNFLVTSPPYGDNTSTVPYGQASYLPLNWINLADIDRSVSKMLVQSTHILDRLSLGGSRRNVLDHRSVLASTYPVAKKWFSALESKSRDCNVRAASFAKDLDAAVKTISSAMAPKAWMMWTVANRNLGGLEMPLAQLLKEMLAAQGFHHVVTRDRVIKRKRMASLNSQGLTMSKEQVMLFQRGYLKGPPAA